MQKPYQTVASGQEYTLRNKGGIYCRLRPYETQRVLHIALLNCPSGLCEQVQHPHCTGQMCGTKSNNDLIMCLRRIRDHRKPGTIARVKECLFCLSELLFHLSNIEALNVAQ